MDGINALLIARVKQLLDFPCGMFLNKVMQSTLLLGGQFAELQADLAHFDGAEAVFIGDLKIEYLSEGNLIQI